MPNIVAQPPKLFNPSARSFALTGSMTTPKSRHTETLLRNCKTHGC
jgi:hypothetical protein